MSESATSDSGQHSAQAPAASSAPSSAATTDSTTLAPPASVPPPPPSPPQPQQQQPPQEGRQDATERPASPLTATPFDFHRAVEGTQQPTAARAEDDDSRVQPTVLRAPTAASGNALVRTEPARWSEQRAWDVVGTALEGESADAEEQIAALKRQCAPRLPPGPSSTYIGFPYSTPFGGPLTLAVGIEDGTEELAVLLSHATAPPYVWAVGDRVMYSKRSKRAEKEGVLLGITHNAPAKSYTAWLWLQDDYEKVPVAQLHSRVGRTNDLAALYKAIMRQEHAHASAPVAVRAAPPSRRSGRLTNKPQQATQRPKPPQSQRRSRKRGRTDKGKRKDNHKDEEEESTSEEDEEKQEQEDAAPPRTPAPRVTAKPAAAAHSILHAPVQPADMAKSPEHNTSSQVRVVEVQHMLTQLQHHEEDRAHHPHHHHHHHGHHSHQQHGDIAHELTGIKRLLADLRYEQEAAQLAQEHKEAQQRLFDKWHQ